MEAPQQAPAEKIAPTDDADVDALMDAALDKIGDNKAAALAEERRSAQLIRDARASEEAAGAQTANPAIDPDEPQDLGSIAARGREYLMERLQRHNEEVAARPPYVPPPVSEQMQARINEELEAGRRAQAKHEHQKANRPVPDRNANEIAAEGTNTVVARPGNMVTDPRAFNGKEGLAPMRQST